MQGKKRTRLHRAVKKLCEGSAVFMRGPTVVGEDSLHESIGAAEIASIQRDLRCMKGWKRAMRNWTLGKARGS